MVATESANNATVGGTLVPTLSLGIPGDASSAMLLGALLILGFIPGPAMFENNPDVVGGIFMVYLLSNVFLLIAGILATPLFVYVLRIPKVYLIPSILLLCSIGTFALQASVFDLQVMFAFGLIGLLDDWLKVSRMTSNGLKSYQKIIPQIFIAFLDAGLI